MSFAVGADAYDRFMGRYSGPLAPVFVEFAAAVDPSRVLDVGCGPGALTAELVRRLGPGAVAAVDPSESFVAAAQARYPAADERALWITVEHPTFADWWEPFTLGVGPAGEYVAGLDVVKQRELRERCRDTLPTEPFAVTARAWAASGRNL